MKKLSILLSLIVLFSCFPQARSAEDGNEVVAEVHGRKITQGELNKSLGPDLFEMKKRIYDLKSKKLDELIGKVLLEKEAAKRKMPVEKLLDKYVNSKVKKVSTKDIDKFYKENKGHLRGTKDQYIERIRSFLAHEKKQQAYEKYITSLKKRARANIYLKKPERFRVALSLTPGPTKGNENAKVEIVEFSDFQCPFCSKLADTVDKVFKKYRRKVKLTFKAFPLSRHEDAPLAHQASLCADDQEKFWPYHDLLFKNQRKLKREDLERYAKDARLTLDKFKQCLDSGDKFAKVQKEISEGEQAGVRSTPTLFVNGQMVVGNVTQANLEEIINAELKRK